GRRRRDDRGLQRRARQSLARGSRPPRQLDRNPGPGEHGPGAATRPEALTSMDITRNVETMKGPAEWFTGDVFIDAVAAPAGTSTFAAASVHFTPGARTAWHTHPHGQTIFVIEGVGRCQREG